MKRTKKIYRYVNRLVDYCKWCDGAGWTGYLGRCSTCKGTGGLKYKRVRMLIGEEVME